MAILKQNTAYTRQFLMVLSSDHITGATGKSPVVKLGKAANSGVTASNSPAVEIDSTNLPGMYYISLGTGDTNVLGDLTIAATASGCDPTNVIDQVQSQIFTDLILNANGRVMIDDNLQQNTALNGFLFVMTNSSSHLPQTGLTVTAQRTLAAGGFAPCTNSVTEVANGFYSINLAAADLNAGTVGLRFTATGADDLDILLVPTP